MSSVRDPVALTFLTITHLSSDDRAWSTPSIELTATSPTESSSRTLSLPVEDLGAREEDVGSFKAWTHGDCSVVPLRVVEIHDRLHRVLPDLKGSLITSISRCLGVHRELLAVQQRVDHTSVQPVVHPEDC